MALDPSLIGSDEGDEWTYGTRRTLSGAEYQTASANRCAIASTGASRLKDRYVRACVGVLVSSAHITFGWIALQQVGISAHVMRSVMPLTVIALGRKGNAPISTAIIVDPIQSGDTNRSPPVYVAIQPELTTSAQTRSIGTTIPPHPDKPLIDTKPFAQQAGLSPGTGVTIVLRVEVRGDGSVGRVEVEVSGGTRQIDAAAIAFARALRWIGGRIADRPATIWIRWGVRLDG